MLRLAFLVLYLVASYSWGQAKGGLPPKGPQAPVLQSGDLTGNLDPDG